MRKYLLRCVAEGWRGFKLPFCGGFRGFLFWKSVFLG